MVTEKEILRRLEARLLARMEQYPERAGELSGLLFQLQRRMEED